MSQYQPPQYQPPAYQQPQQPYPYPQQPVVQYTGQKPEGPLELRVYPGEDCRGSLYLDDGASFDYQKGAYLRVNYTCQVATGTVKLNISRPEGTFAPWWNQIQVQVFGVSASPTQVQAAGTPVAGWKFDAANHSVLATIPNPAGGTQITVTYPSQ